MTTVASPRICVVSVHYYDAYIERSLANLRLLCGALEPAACIVVSNNRAIDARLRREQADGPSGIGEIVAHDNVGMEFGAYQAGIDRARSAGEMDWYVVLNDTFGIHECFATPLRNNFVRAVRDPQTSTLPIVVGQVDETPRSFSLAGFRTHRWARSNVLGLNVVAMRALDWRLHSPELDRLIEPASPADAFFSSELDPVLRNRIEGWLFPAEANAGWGWYKGEQLSAANAERLARKARSILQEKYISARLDEASAIFINIKQMSMADDIRRGLEKRWFHWRHGSQGSGGSRSA